MLIDRTADMSHDRLLRVGEKGDVTEVEDKIPRSPYCFFLSMCKRRQERADSRLGGAGKRSNTTPLCKRRVTNTEIVTLGCLAAWLMLSHRYVVPPSPPHCSLTSMLDYLLTLGSADTLNWMHGHLGCFNRAAGSLNINLGLRPRILKEISNQFLKVEVCCHVYECYPLSAWLGPSPPPRLFDAGLATLRTCKQMNVIWLRSTIQCKVGMSISFYNIYHAPLKHARSLSRFPVPQDSQPDCQCGGNNLRC